MLIPQWIIEKKRDGEPLSTEEISEFIQRYHTGDIPDYQMAALAMAIFLQGMSFEETTALTNAMMHTGEILDTSSLSRPICDKHSTGGIGDKVSLILAPLAAAAGLAVPMISGRGLGITGGTLDKLASIPGYRTDLPESHMLRIVDSIGCSIIGQTDSLAPADKKLYALRDVTGTVPSIPLITASIMSKKMAEGLDALVLDVKSGRGAFMKTPEQARQLAQNLVRVGEHMHKPVGALITNMDIPLGHCVGNALEVREALECLQGNLRGPLWELTRELTAAMLLLSHQADDWETARESLEDHLASGRPLDLFQRMIEAHGGDPRICDDPSRLPAAEILKHVPASQNGWVADVNAEDVGRAVLLLGGGRTRSEDPIDPAVGISSLVSPGHSIHKNQPLYTLHANHPERLAEAEHLLRDAITLSPDPLPAPNLIYEHLMP